MSKPQITKIEANRLITSMISNDTKIHILFPNSPNYHKAKKEVDKASMKILSEYEVVK